jgi:uncharacterized small protein (DUF1192 family)
MTAVAVTDIIHGYVDDEGQNHTVEIKAGESVDALPDDVIEHLESIGSVSEEVLPEATAERIAGLEDEIASLRAQLASAEGHPGAKQSVSQIMTEANAVATDTQDALDDEVDVEEPDPDAEPEFDNDNDNDNTSGGGNV